MSAGLDDLTIGIPVYNEVRFIGQAIESVLNQAGRIIIADNASTDGTSELCRTYVEKYKHISYFRFPNNMGSRATGTYCLDNAQTRYFMWLGAHDYLGENHCSELLRALCENPDVVLAFGDARYVDETGILLGSANDDLSLTSSPSRVERMCEVIKNHHHGYAFYGLYRTSQLRDVFVRRVFFGPDTVTLIKLAGVGRFAFVESARSYIRKFNRPDSFQAYFERLGGPRQVNYSIQTLNIEILKVLITAPCPSLREKFVLIRKGLRALKIRSGSKWTNRYWYGALIRSIPVVGPIWAKWRAVIKRRVITSKDAKLK